MTAKPIKSTDKIIAGASIDDLLATSNDEVSRLLAAGRREEACAQIGAVSAAISARCALVMLAELDRMTGSEMGNMALSFMVTGLLNIADGCDVSHEERRDLVTRIMAALPALVLARLHALEDVPGMKERH